MFHFFYNTTSDDQKVFFDRILVLLFKFSSVLFLVIILIDLFFFPEKKYARLIGDIIGIILLSKILISQHMRLILTNICFILQLMIFSVWLFITIIFESVFPGYYATESILVATLVCLIPCFLSLFSEARYLFAMITSGIICCCLFSCIYTNQLILYKFLPLFSFIFVILSASLFFFKRWYKKEIFKAQLLNEKKKMADFILFELRQQELTKHQYLHQQTIPQLNYCVENHIYTESSDPNKDIINMEISLINLLKKNYPDLTISELQICFLIMRGKSVQEINLIQNIDVPTLMSIYRRLTAKLGLKETDNLQLYLQLITHSSLN